MRADTRVGSIALIDGQIKALIEFQT